MTALACKALPRASALLIANVILVLMLFLSLATLLFQNYRLPSQLPSAFHYYTSEIKAEAQSVVASAASGKVKASSVAWSDVTTLLTFGDSLSDSAFAPQLEQPSSSNPFGNPPYPKSRFLGPNWADFLTIAHNESLLLNYNFAKGGATIDNRIVASPYGSPSLYDQTNVFKARYAKELTDGRWDAARTIALIRFGVNDCVGPYLRHETLDLTKDMNQFAAQVERLYANGVRNFLFLNVGPVDRNFMKLKGDPVTLPRLTSDVAEWNAALGSLQANVSDQHADVTTWLFDTHAFFLWLEQHSVDVPATKLLRNTTGICPFYAAPNHDPFIPEGQDTWFMDEPDCGAALDKYFWANQFHPTYSVHNATAATIVEDCFGSSGRKRFCT